MFRYRKREQRRKQRHRFLHGQSILAQHVFEFHQFLVRGLLGLKPQQALEQIRQRKQCCVLRVPRTPTFPAPMWLVCNVLLQHLD